MTMTHTPVGPDSTVLVADPGESGTILRVKNVGEVPVWLGDQDVTIRSGEALPAGVSRSLPSTDALYAIAGPTGSSTVQATTASEFEIGDRPLGDLDQAVGEGQSPELLRLLHARNERPLTEAERLRLAAFTFTTDPALELAMILKLHHPQIYAMLTTDVPIALAAYGKRRGDARDGGRRIAEPTPGAIATLAANVKAFEAVRRPPEHLRDIETKNRELFRAAFLAGGVDGETMAAWRAWLEDIEDLVVFQERRALAAQAVGLPWHGGGRDMPPSLMREIEQAAGGLRVL